MTNFYDKLPFEAATRMEALSRLMYELRENRARLLAPYSVEDEVQLLERIRTGCVAEHPAYEHYLGARALGDARDAARDELRAMLAPARQP